MNGFFRFLIISMMVSYFAFGAEWEDEFAQKVNEVEAMEKIAYPYSDFPDQLRAEGKKSVTIFSYGSLLIRSSALKTLTEETVDTTRQAVAFGVVRVFDRDVAIVPGSHWGVPDDPNAKGMLNLRKSENRYEMVNGVVLEVRVEEIIPLMEREEGYDLLPVLIMDIEESDKQGKPVYKVAYTFYAPPDSIYTDGMIAPRPCYCEASRDAAKEYGPLFYHMWMESTLRANGEPL